MIERRSLLPAVEQRQERRWARRSALYALVRHERQFNAPPPSALFARQPAVAPRAARARLRSQRVHETGAGQSRPDLAGGRIRGPGIASLRTGGQAGRAAAGRSAQRPRSAAIRHDSGRSRPAPGHRPALRAQRRRPGDRSGECDCHRGIAGVPVSADGNPDRSGRHRLGRGADIFCLCRDAPRRGGADSRPGGGQLGSVARSAGRRSGEVRRGRPGRPRQTAVSHDLLRQPARHVLFLGTAPGDLRHCPPPRRGRAAIRDCRGHRVSRIAL
ncbi:MAG: hypothetical protein BWZ10_03329 [candidate division BRC1 bacterium ADurb.BinA364]|nr:MAG: hypothetical protein BWZ10_03329 [candidate division BRC1 bacterium ADurb.BinA364]